MVFIQSSEASQANSQQLAIAQTTIEALAELLKLLLAKKEDEQQKGDAGKQEVEAKPSGFSDAAWDKVSRNGIRTSWMIGGADIRLHPIFPILLTL